MISDENEIIKTDFYESLIPTQINELSSREKRFRSIIEQTTDAMYLTDLNGKIIDVNKQACKTMGYTRDELLELNITDLDGNHNTNEKTLDFFKSMLPGQNLIFESIHLKKTGETLPVEISSSKIELDGVSHVIGFARDITNRKIAAEALREREEHFRILFEQASDGILISDAKGKFMDVNSSGLAILGYSKEEFKQLSIQDILPEDSSKYLRNIFYIIQEKGIITNELKFVRKDKSFFDAEIVVKKLPDGKLQAMIHDITNRKLAEKEIRKLNDELEKKVIDRTRQLEKRTRELFDNQKALLNLVEDLNEKSTELTNKTEQLQLANKELEAFSYSVSHDLRAPLRAINGFVSILLEDYYSKLDDEGKRICNIIQSNALKMGQLIDDLLSFSRLVRSEIKNSNIDMKYMVKQTVAELSSQQKITNINLSIGEIPQAMGDPSMIRQVWINLISNAIKYSSLNEQIDIQIGATINDNEIIYFIKDNGIGFDMNYANKLFGVFQRLHNRKEFEGTGVGLAIVQRIIHRHNGRVWAESELGNGSTFYFTLPKQKLI